MDVPFGGSLILFPIFGVKYPQNPNFWGVFKPNGQNIESRLYDVRRRRSWDCRRDGGGSKQRLAASWNKSKQASCNRLMSSLQGRTETHLSRCLAWSATNTRNSHTPIPSSSNCSASAVKGRSDVRCALLRVDWKCRTWKWSTKWQGMKMRNHRNMTGNWRTIGRKRSQNVISG